MLIILPFLLLSLALSCGICAAAGYSGLQLAGMLLLWFAAVFAASLLAYLLFLVVTSLFADRERPVERPSRFYRGLIQYSSAVIAVLGRVRLHLSGGELIPAGRFLLVCNHRSNFDPLLTGWLLRRYELSFITKPENIARPVAGRLAHRAGYLAIDRENDRAALRTVLAAADLLKRNVCSICVYPEGTRNRAAEMLPFRNGAFKIAQKAGVPIVVAVIRGTDEIERHFPLRRSEVTLRICGVMDAETVRCSSTAEIGAEVRKQMTAL